MHGLTLRFRHGAHTVYTADGCASAEKGHTDATW